MIETIPLGESMIWWCVAILASLYVGICAGLFLLQRRIVFVPHIQPLDPIPPEFSLPYEKVSIPVSTSQHLAGWWFPQADSQNTLLFLHGNGGLTSFNFEAIALWYDAGFSVLVVNYRGYGKSSASFPSEVQVYEDAVAAYDFLAHKLGDKMNCVMVHGHSLGGAIAIELACQRPVAGLFLESTFTSMVAMANINPVYRLFPITTLLNQKFDSETKITQLRLPTVICHGGGDEDVPSTLGEKLWAIAREPKRQLLIPTADHHNAIAVSPDLIRAEFEWLQNQV